MAIIRRDDEQRGVALARTWRKLSPAAKGVITVSAGGALWAAQRLLHGMVKRGIPTINVRKKPTDTRAVQRHEQKRPRRIVIHARRVRIHRTPDGHVYGEDAAYTVDVDDDV